MANVPKSAPDNPPTPRVRSLYKDDSIQFDTSKAPWMAIAMKELGKDVKELRDDSSFERLWYLALVESKREWTTLSRSQEQSKFSLFGNKRDKLDLLGSFLKKADAEQGQSLARANPQITKYFDGLRNDPDFDPKGRSRNMAAASKDRHGDWQMTAWCAAFVNWCLQQAGSPHLGYATAISWLEFGTPLPTPVYGCITIIPPAADTGSGTGHVGFYEKTAGNSVILIGGNQSDEVRRSRYSKVLGYRWPTAFNYYLTPEVRPSSLA
jgi:uncharacterized protein (TIGR02594 family)